MNIRVRVKNWMGWMDFQIYSLRIEAVLDAGLRYLRYLKKIVRIHRKGT